MDNLVSLWENAVKRFGDNPYIGTRSPSGAYVWVTYRDVDERVARLRSGLSRLGVGRGDAVGIIANNRLEWVIAAFATYGLGARYVPMYESELMTVCKYIVTDSAVKVLLVSKPEILEKVRAFPEELPSLETVVLIEGEGKGTLAELESAGAAERVPSVTPRPEEIAGLIYTSGTTGDPKGVLLSHRNFCSNVLAACGGFPVLSSQDRCISILPWAHSYAQTVELYTFTHLGGSIGIMGSTATLVQDMAQVRPTFVIAVPRVFNKIYDALQTAMTEKGGIAKRLFDMGLESARKRRESAARGKADGNVLDALKFRLADRIVFQKIRDRFGGRLTQSLTGSAAINPEIHHFFHDIGIPLYESYGMTEASPGISANCPAANRMGSVGRPLPGIRVAIDASVVEEGATDGEIIVYGPNVMQGYHNKPEQTREVLTPDGGLRTGDRGRLDDDGFLHITGRIKEQFKLENGKFVFPAALEEDIMLVPWVQNALIYGENRLYTICLVVPDFFALERYAAKTGIDADPKTLIGRREIQDMIAGDIAGALKGRYGGYEIPKRFLFLTDAFSVENGLMTQTMKLKRKAILERFKPDIEALYAS